jgi:ABC-type phosphate transport system ATPase subunit
MSSTARSRRSTDVSIDVTPRIVTAFIGPVGLRQVHLPALLNRMNDTDRLGARVEGKIDARRP